MTEQQTVEITIEVDVSYSTVWNDYGVDHSPRWIEDVDHTLDEIRINGKVIQQGSLPDDVVDMIFDYGIEGVEL